MRRISLIVILSCLLGRARDSVPRVVTSKLDAIIRTQEVIDVGEALDFEWDMLFVFPPYTPQSQIKEKIGREMTESPINLFDSFALLVFMHQGKVVGFAEFDRSIGDFTATPGGVGIPRAQAKFLKQNGPHNRVILKSA